MTIKDHANYKLYGLDQDTETKEYLEKIVQGLLEIPVTEKQDDEKKIYENYRETLIESSLLKGLKAKGYYDAKVKYQDSTEDLKGDYKISEGALYTISDISIQSELFQQYFDALSIQKNMPVEAVPILQSEAALYQVIQKDGCYFNLDVFHEVVLDRATKTAKVIYNVEAGPNAVFDTVIFSGQKTVELTYLQKLIPFKEGECFRREKIEKLRTALLATNLFSRAQVNIPDEIVEGEKVPVNIELKERAQRTVRIGGSYYTDEGPGIVVGWEHRNFLGAAEKLEAQIKASQSKQRVVVDFTKPLFYRKDQSLSLSAALNREESDAYDELSISTGGSVKRSFNKRLSGNTGVELKLTRIEDKNTLEKENFGLISFPNFVTFDNRDNKLNPHKGWQIRGTIKPFIDVLGNSSAFVKSRLTASTYFGFQKDSDTILALRASVGSINGADIEDIPATERFYAGGGGSIRGYGYQEVGPVKNGDPSGGASIVETSAELRFKITDTVGAVGFVDLGNVNQHMVPSFSDLSVGAGVGLRYYTSFGPLRLDVATPLTNKKFTDSNYQIYISIGQAF